MGNSFSATDTAVKASKPQQEDEQPRPATAQQAESLPQVTRDAAVPQGAKSTQTTRGRVQTAARYHTGTPVSAIRPPRVQANATGMRKAAYAATAASNGSFLLATSTPKRPGLSHNDRVSSIVGPSKKKNPFRPSTGVIRLSRSYSRPYQQAVRNRQMTAARRSPSRQNSSVLHVTPDMLVSRTSSTMTDGAETRAAYLERIRGAVDEQREHHLQQQQRMQQQNLHRDVPKDAATAKRHTDLEDENPTKRATRAVKAPPPANAAMDAPSVATSLAVGTLKPPAYSRESSRGSDTEVEDNVDTDHEQSDRDHGEGEEGNARSQQDGPLTKRGRTLSTKASRVVKKKGIHSAPSTASLPTADAVNPTSAPNLDVPKPTKPGKRRSPAVPMEEREKIVLPPGTVPLKTSPSQESQLDTKRRKGLPDAAPATSSSMGTSSASLSRGPSSQSTASTDEATSEPASETTTTPAVVQRTPTRPQVQRRISVTPMRPHLLAAELERQKSLLEEKDMDAKGNDKKKGATAAEKGWAKERKEERSQAIFAVTHGILRSPSQVSKESASADKESATTEAAKSVTFNTTKPQSADDSAKAPKATPSPFGGPAKKPDEDSSTSQAVKKNPFGAKKAEAPGDASKKANPFGGAKKPASSRPPPLSTGDGKPSPFGGTKADAGKSPSSKVNPFNKGPARSESGSTTTTTTTAPAEKSSDGGAEGQQKPQRTIPNPFGASKSSGSEQTAKPSPFGAAKSSGKANPFGKPASTPAQDTPTIPSASSNSNKNAELMASQAAPDKAIPNPFSGASNPLSKNQPPNPFGSGAKASGPKFGATANPFGGAKKPPAFGAGKSSTPDTPSPFSANTGDNPKVAAAAKVPNPFGAKSATSGSGQEKPSNPFGANSSKPRPTFGLKTPPSPVASQQQQQQQQQQHHQQQPFGAAKGKVPTFGAGRSSGNGDSNAAPNKFGSPSGPPKFGSNSAATKPTFGSSSGTKKPAFGSRASAPNAFGKPPQQTPTGDGPTFGRSASSSTPGLSNSATNKPSFGSNKPTFGSSNSTTNKPSFGSNKPTFGSSNSATNKPSFGSNKPSFGSSNSATNKPSFGSNKPSFGSSNSATNKPSFGSNKPSFGSNKPTFGSSNSATNKPSFGSNKPSFGSSNSATNKPSFGSNKPSFGSSNSSNNAFGQGGSRPSFGSGRRSNSGVAPPFNSTPNPLSRGSSGSFQQPHQGQPSFVAPQQSQGGDAGRVRRRRSRRK